MMIRPKLSDPACLTNYTIYIHGTEHWDALAAPGGRGPIASAERESDGKAPGCGSGGCGVRGGLNLWWRWHVV